MSQVPPPIYSNYPRQSPQVAWPIRPPGVYFDAVGDAWTALTAQLAVWLPVALIVGLAYVAMVAIQFAFLYPTMFTTGRMAPGQANQVLATIIQIIPYSILACLVAGAMATAVRQLNGELVNVGMIFTGFRRYAALLMLCVVQSAFSLVIQLGTAGMGGFGTTSTDIVAMLAFVVVALIAYIGLLYPLQTFVPTDLVLNPDRGFFDAIREAYRRTWSPLLALKFFLLNLIAGLVLIAGYCACGIGLLFAGPLVLLLYALHYRYFYPPQTIPETARNVFIGEAPPE
jgi:hypothetical protein